MYAIVARYHGPTDHRGSRYIVRSGMARTTHAYDYESGDAARAAIVAHLRTLTAWIVPESIHDGGSGHIYADTTHGETIRFVLGTLPEGTVSSPIDGDRIAVATAI